MKLLLIAVAVFAIAHGKSLSGQKIDKSDDWFVPLRDLGTEIIVETFQIEEVRGLVKETVEGCMQQDDVTTCLEDAVDTVSDALGEDASQADREDAKVKVAALSDFLGAVYGSCRNVAGDNQIGACAWAEGKRFCAASEFDQQECMKGVLYVLAKAKELNDKRKGKKDKKGLDTSDDWFEPLRELGTEIISETFELDAVKDKVRATVEKCMQEDDTTECLKDDVDEVADALGQDVSQEDREDAKAKVGALSDFLGAVYGACKDVPEDKIGECAFGTGKKMCAKADDKKRCMGGVMYVLKKAKEMAEAKSDKRGLDKDDGWFEPLRDLGTEIISETFGLEGVKDKVKATVEKCMQEDDTTDCLQQDVDNVADALGQDVTQEDREDAKAKVGALSDFLGAVYGACKDVPEDKIGECAFGTGKKMCAKAGDKKRCMKGVMYVLGKAKEMAEKADRK